MTPRNVLRISSGALAMAGLSPRGVAGEPAGIDAAWYRLSRRFAALPVGRVAYVERDRGPAALFVHGFPLSGFQWRGALDRLHVHRRCIAPDLMSMGATETREGQAISLTTHAAMLTMLLDTLRIDSVDVIANDSGGATVSGQESGAGADVADDQLRVDENSPPAAFLPVIELAKKGTFVAEFIVPQLKDKQLARSVKGLGLVSTHPEKLADETIETYLRPIVETPLRKAQMSQFTVSMGTNPLVAIREDLRRWRGPARMVWGLKDRFFGVEWAEWLERTLPGSRGVRMMEGANLFFPEEMPELIAEEAVRLWDIQPSI